MKIENEAALRDLFRRGITSIGGQSKHLEDSINSGIPDVVAQLAPGRTRWIEVKHIKAWPKRVTTGVRLKHFSPAQIGFLMSWHGAWVLLGVGSGEALLFRGLLFAESYAYGKLPTRDDLIARCSFRIKYNERVGLSIVEASKMAEVVFKL